MVAKGLVSGTAGNVSGRMPDGNVVMTPSSVAYETMTVDDLVVVDLDGQTVDGERGPTSEKALHLSCYRSYDEVGGVIHCHATYASMFALVRQPIPAVIEEFVVYVGGDVPIAAYKPTGSDELADEIATHLHRPVLRPHGQPRPAGHRPGHRRRAPHRPSASSTTPASSGAPRPSATPSPSPTRTSRTSPASTSSSAATPGAPGRTEGGAQERIREPSGS